MSLEIITQIPIPGFNQERAEELVEQGNVAFIPPRRKNPGILGVTTKIEPYSITLDPVIQMTGHEIRDVQAKIYRSAAREIYFGYIDVERAIMENYGKTSYAGIMEELHNRANRDKTIKLK